MCGWKDEGLTKHEATNDKATTISFVTLSLRVMFFSCDIKTIVVMKLRHAVTSYQNWIQVIVSSLYPLRQYYDNLETWKSWIFYSQSVGHQDQGSRLLERLQGCSLRFKQQRLRCGCWSRFFPIYCCRLIFAQNLKLKLWSSNRIALVV